MTILQKIIGYSTGKDTRVGEVFFKEDINNSAKLSYSDRLCGAYGALFVGDMQTGVTIPESVFINLDGTVRYDAKSSEVAFFIKEQLLNLGVEGLCLEFGGDSLTYLTMQDRLCIAEKLSELSPFCILFESDFNTVMYIQEHGMPEAPMFLNDGEHNYKKVITLNLSGI